MTPLPLKCHMSLGGSSIVLLLLQFSSQSRLKRFWAPLLSRSFLLIMDQLTIRWAGDGCRAITKPLRGDSTVTPQLDPVLWGMAKCCMLSEWMERTPRLGYSLLCSAVLSTYFLGCQGSNPPPSPQKEINFFSVEIQDLQQNLAVSIIQQLDRE